MHADSSLIPRRWGDRRGNESEGHVVTAMLLKSTSMANSGMEVPVAHEAVLVSSLQNLFFKSWKLAHVRVRARQHVATTSGIRQLGFCGAKLVPKGFQPEALSALCLQRHHVLYIASLQGYRRCSTKLCGWRLTRCKKLVFCRCWCKSNAPGAAHVAESPVQPDSGFPQTSRQDAIDVLNDQYKPNAQTRDAFEWKQQRWAWQLNLSRLAAIHRDSRPGFVPTSSASPWRQAFAAPTVKFLVSLQGRAKAENSGVNHNQCPQGTKCRKGTFASISPELLYHRVLCNTTLLGRTRG